MPQIPYTDRLLHLLDAARQLAATLQQEFLTPEHFVCACVEKGHFAQRFDPSALNHLRTDLHRYVESLPTLRDAQSSDRPEASHQWNMMLTHAAFLAKSAQVGAVDVTHVVAAVCRLPESMAHTLLEKHLGGEGALLAALIAPLPLDDANDTDKTPSEEEADPGAEGAEWATTAAPDWRKWVTCVNDHLSEHNPLIGRKDELERTIRVLCRLDKNNPVHVGDPGVGKTALIYGLAALIEAGDVPERLRGARIYALNLGTLLSGTQYRGDFEKRLLAIIDGLAEEGNAMAYIDEIHNLVGAGQTGEGSLDASNLLKPYLESGSVRFIGATTHEEYNRYLAKSQALVRRFQTIDVPEPSTDEAILILQGLRGRYERFHGVTFADGVIEHAVRMSERYLRERRLPDKAIDLIDEAAAYREVHPDGSGTVDAALVDDMLAAMCNVDALRNVDADAGEQLAELRPALLRRIFGQDRAVDEVTEAVMMSRAGLTEENKPVASLLFVGPTGVGKTEVAKVLAEQLSVPLVRFDMSEYAEKHTVSRLIGAPAGYVGYEDGGLLTDAVRKSPHCVLLLDEIEKAHADIFNILLQVMDRAALTDTHGRTVDFRHVILILTSNAGAQFARRAAVGFGGTVTPGDAMLAEVKKTFKPEFINRLSATVVFGEMTHDMAVRILDKKLDALRALLAPRGVTLHLGEAARELLLRRGFTREYGAREMDRAIAALLKPLLTRALLFGALRKGGEAHVDCEGETLVIRDTHEMSPISTQV